MLGVHTGALEVHLHAHLEVARQVVLRGDRAEAGVADRGVGQAKGNLVEDVEGFGAELETQFLVNWKALDYRNIVVEGDRPTQRTSRAGHVAKLKRLRKAETGWVEVTLRLSRSTQTLVCRPRGQGGRSGVDRASSGKRRSASNGQPPAGTPS